jgi:hypothetical protein
VGILVVSVIFIVSNIVRFLQGDQYGVGKISRVLFMGQRRHMCIPSGAWQNPSLEVGSPKPLQGVLGLLFYFQ